MNAFIIFYLMELIEMIQVFKSRNIKEYIYIFIFKFFFQSISFSIKENINILIEKEENINTKEFEDEILKYGNVNFFKNERFHKLIKSKKNNNKIKAKFNCFLIEGKYIIIFYLL